MNKRIKKKKGIYTRFKDKETWSLDYTVACFVLPRLIRYKKLNNGHPVFLNDQGEIDGTIEDPAAYWDAILDDMIWSFEQLADREENSPIFKPGKETADEYRNRYNAWNDKVQHGLNLFARYFSDLWW